MELAYTALPVDLVEIDAEESLKTLDPCYWEEVFAEEDPWDYSTSGYEDWKFQQTLALIPEGARGSALEIACAEGHLTARLAPLMAEVTAIDISPTALARAEARCAALGNVRFQRLNLAQDPLPGPVDLVLCSEVLFYLPLELLREVAPKIVASLKPGGHLLLAHGNLISDDRSVTGFDWGHPFGAKTIGQVFAALDNVSCVKELRTPLFTAQLFRRLPRRGKRVETPEILDVPLPDDLVLTPRLEKYIHWDGVETTREEACTREVSTGVPILMYHSVAASGPDELAPYRVTPQQFAEQLRYLRRHGYYSVTLEEWASCIEQKRALPGRPVILTFDDGYQDFFENAWPLLERSGFSASIFVVADKVSGRADWEDFVAKPLKLMGWDELRALAEGGIEIGSHSATHKDLSLLTAEAVFEEGARARAVLQEKLGWPIGLIAFPWGRAEAKARDVLARCGYRIGLTTWGGRSGLSDDPMNLPRIEIFGEDDLAAFAARLQPPVAEAEAEPVASEIAEEALEDWVGFEAEEADELVGFDVDEAASPAGPAGAGDLELVGFGAEAVAGSPADSLSPIVQRRDLVGEPAEAVGFAGETGDATSTRAAIMGFETDSAVGFGAAGFARPAPRGAVEPEPVDDGPLHPGYEQQLGARLDSLVCEFVKLQSELLRTFGGRRVTLQRRLAGLFSLPVTGEVHRSLRPRDEIAPGALVSFEETAQVELTTSPKADHIFSPETHLNKLQLRFAGASPWLAIEVALDWRDLSLAQHFQLNIVATPSRWVACHAAIRFPCKAGRPPIETMFARLELDADDRSASTAGELDMPDFIELDTGRTPQLLIFFDTSDWLSIDIHYLNVYFA